MKTHPFVLGLIVALLTDNVMKREPKNIREFLYYLSLIIVPAGIIAGLEWYTRLDDGTKKDTNETQEHDG